MKNTMTVQFELPDAVVVTGASSGLGSEVCQMLLARGVTTLGVDISEPPAAVAAAPGYLHVCGNVADEGTWEKVISLLGTEGVRHYGLVTCAAILHVGTLLETSKAEFERSLQINVIGTALAMKALLPLMIEAGGGPIVAVASVDATFAEQQLVTYCSTKGAVRQVARATAMDHARKGIRVNVLSPGPMMAGLFKRHMSSADDPAKFESARAERQPGGAILDAAQVASAALFLLSSGSSAINGAELIADGGLTTSFDFRTGTEGASVR